MMGPVGGPLPWRSLVALAISGVFLNQLVFLKGLALTSPVVAGALQPSIPIFTFILAVALGSESLNLRRRDGVLKLTGVLLCVLGAFITSTYQGEVIIRGRESEPALAALVAAGGAWLTFAHSVPVHTRLLIRILRLIVFSYTIASSSAFLSTPCVS